MSALIERLQKDPEEIKILQEIMPICTSCKNIRDGKGNWHYIDVYIKEHYQAEYTDSICPECAKKIIWNLFNN